MWCDMSPVLCVLFPLLTFSSCFCCNFSQKTLAIQVIFNLSSLFPFNLKRVAPFCERLHRSKRGEGLNCLFNRSFFFFFSLMFRRHKILPVCLIHLSYPNDVLFSLIHPVSVDAASLLSIRTQTSSNDGKNAGKSSTFKLQCWSTV